jgi:hypothetical protein
MKEYHIIDDKWKNKMEKEDAREDKREKLAVN